MVSSSQNNLSVVSNTLIKINVGITTQLQFKNSLDSQNSVDLVANQFRKIDMP